MKKPFHMRGFACQPHHRRLIINGESCCGTIASSYWNLSLWGCLDYNQVEGKEESVENVGAENTTPIKIHCKQCGNEAIVHVWHVEALGCFGILESLSGSLLTE